MNLTTDIYDNLVTNNILGGTDNWTLSAGIFKEEEKRAAIIITGETQSPYNSSSLIRYPSFQILFCAANYDTAYNKADEVYKYLLQTASITNYVTISPKSGILHLGQNKEQLHSFSINFECLNIE